MWIFKCVGALKIFGQCLHGNLHSITLYSILKYKWFTFDCLDSTQQNNEIEWNCFFVLSFCRCYLNSNLIVLQRFMWSEDRRKAAPSSFHCSANSDLFWSAANPGWHKDNFEISLQREKFVGRRQLPTEVFSFLRPFNHSDDQNQESGCPTFFHSNEQIWCGTVGSA